MKAEANEIGRVVRSLQGRDKGRLYAVVGVPDARIVLVCDGDARKLSRPKKKRVKHLLALPLTVAVEGRGAGGGAVDDSDIRKALAAAWKGYQQQLEGPDEGREEKEECAFVQRGCH